MVTTERSYPLSKASLLNAINDMMEWQKGDEYFADNASGKLFFVTTMYGRKQQNRFTVTEAEGGCKVSLELDNGSSEENSINAIFALLEGIILQFGDTVSELRSP